LRLCGSAFHGFGRRFWRLIWRLIEEDDDFAFTEPSGPELAVLNGCLGDGLANAMSQRP
jgi:hypothetical protein